MNESVKNLALIDMKYPTKILLPFSILEGDFWKSLFSSQLKDGNDRISSMSKQLFSNLKKYCKDFKNFNNIQDKAFIIIFKLICSRIYHENNLSGDFWRSHKIFR